MVTGGESTDDSIIRSAKSSSDMPAPAESFYDELHKAGTSSKAGILSPEQMVMAAQAAEKQAPQAVPRTPPLPSLSLPEVKAPPKAEETKEAKAAREAKEAEAAQEAKKRVAERNKLILRGERLSADNINGEWTDHSIETLKLFFKTKSEDCQLTDGKVDKEALRNTMQDYTMLVNRGLEIAEVQHRIGFQTRAETDGSKSYIMQIIGDKNPNAENWAATRGAKDDPYNVIIGRLLPSKKSKPVQ